MEVYGFVGDKRGKGSSNEDILRALNGRFSQALVNALVTGKSDGIADQDAASASFMFRESLRILVNAWIDSAKTKDGEQPWERVFRPELLLQDYVERNPPSLLFSVEGPCLFMSHRNFGERKRLSEFTKTAEEALVSQLQGMESQRVQSLRKIFPFVFDAAISLFLQLLDSPARTRLFRCDGCRTYFVRQRMPKKDKPIGHGTYCENCKREGKDRIRRTENSRGERTKQMIGLAADAWPQWKQDRRHGERTEWIKQQVNKRLESNRNPIAKNWVTRHQKEIEAEVERRNHAKG